MKCIKDALLQRNVNRIAESDDNVSRHAA